MRVPTGIFKVNQLCSMIDHYLHQIMDDVIKKYITYDPYSLDN